jgi:POT family proton-dependent oligopeptide transporter
VKLGIGVGLGVLALVIVLAASGTLTLDAQAIAASMTYTIVGMAALYFAYLFVAGGLTGDEKKRVAVIAVLFVFAAIFWAAFEQAPTSLNLFARDFTDRQLGSFEIPATWFQSVNSFFIIVLAPCSRRSGCGWPARPGAVESRQVRLGSGPRRGRLRPDDPGRQRDRHQRRRAQGLAVVAGRQLLLPDRR